MLKLFITAKSKPIYTTQKTLKLTKKINVPRHLSNCKKKVTNIFYSSIKMNQV